MDISPLSQAPPDLAPFEDTYRFAAFTIIRFAAFSAHALLFGVAAVTVLVLRPTFAGLNGEQWDSSRRRVARRLEGFVQSSVVAAAVAAAAAIVLQAVLIADTRGGDVSPDSFAGTLSTSFGRWQFARLPILIALAALLFGRVAVAALAGAGDARRPARPVWWIAWFVLAACLLLTSTLSGHAVVATPRWLSVTTDALHLIAGAVWFSGIVILSIVLPDAWRGRPGSARVQVLAPAVVRFSTVAAAVIAILAVTGTVNSFLHVGALDDLVDSGYGRALSLKLVLFAGILAIGAVNHFVIRHRLEEAVRRPDEHPAHVFRRTIAAELVVGLLLLGMTGTLVGLSRTKETPTQEPARRGVTSAPRT